jgi:hypothetical protein
LGQKYFKNMAGTVTTINQTQAQIVAEDSQSSMKAKKDSFLGWMNGALTMTWLSSAAANSETGKTAVKAIKNTKAVAETVKKTAEILKNIKQAKSIATWISRIIKGVGVAAAPFTGGTSLAIGLAAGVALDIVAGEAIDAGITMANGGKILDDSKGDWIKLGDWVGQGMHNLVA